MLDLGKSLLDWIEIGRVRRQEPEPGPSRLDDFAHNRRLVAAKIVHDDDVVGLENGHELLFDIGPEAFTVDRSIEDTRRRQPVTAQSAEKGHRSPMTVRGKSTQPLALRPPAPDRRHVGLDPGLVDEDEALGVEMLLQALPPLALASDIGAGLFNGEQCFF